MTNVVDATKHNWRPPMDSSAGTTDNPFSMQHFPEQADSVALAVLAVLAAMSLLSWYVLLTKFWDQFRVRKAYRELERKFWPAGGLREGCAALSGRDNVFRMLVEDGARALHH